MPDEAHYRIKIPLLRPHGLLWGIVCLLGGSTLYILFRPTTLLMFHFTEWVGLTEYIETIRTWAEGFDKYLPIWVVYSLPFALWVLSYLFFIHSIWRDSALLSRYVWFWCIPIIAITAELAQIIHIIPGVFDISDLLILFFATLLAFFFNLRKG